MLEVVSVEMAGALLVLLVQAALGLAGQEAGPVCDDSTCSGHTQVQPCQPGHLQPPKIIPGMQSQGSPLPKCVTLSYYVINQMLSY